MRRDLQIVLGAIVAASLGVGGVWLLTKTPGRALAAPIFGSVVATDAAPDQSLSDLSGDQYVVADQLAGAARLGVVPQVAGPPVEGCAAIGHSAVIDRAAQRTWICDNGQVTQRFVMTSATSQPVVGSYSVYARDLNAWSDLSGQSSAMTHFVAFTYGKYQGARIAFHSIPKYGDGSYAQPFESVGTPERFGDSGGCIRMLPDDAETMWDWLGIGDVVTVIS